MTDVIYLCVGALYPYAHIPPTMTADEQFSLALDFSALVALVSLLTFRNPHISCRRERSLLRRVYTHTPIHTHTDSVLNHERAVVLFGIR